MLPFSLGRGRRWYWFAERASCPWYPSLTTISQRTDGDWIEVIRDAGLRLLDVLVERKALDPVPYLLSMALAFAKSARPADVQVLCRRLEGLRTAEAWHAAGVIHRALGESDAALLAFDAAAGADKAFWRAYNEAGALLASAGRFEDAVQAYGRGLAQNPDSVELNTNIATALLRLGHPEEAIPHCERALAANIEGDAGLRANVELTYSGALDDAGRTEDALAAIDRAIVAVPDHIDGHYNRAQGLMSAGRLAEGWQEFEWRLKRPRANARYDHFPAPRWRGEDVSGKNVLVWTEQGIGDEILLAGMIPDLIARARTVTLLCSARLVGIFRRSFPTARVEERREPLPKAATRPDIDFQMSFADLGTVFRSRFDAFPKRQSFLVADEDRRAVMRRRYTARRPGAPVVGLCWSSLKNYEIGWLKSVDLLSWAPLLRTPGVTFVSLQYGERSVELDRVRERLGVEIVNDPEVDALQDIDGFAAQTAAMDLVISISNTTVHTAGALGVPTWVLLAAGRGRLWYWFRDRADSPWYPSVRLFRQKQGGDWASVVDTIADELGAWMREREG
jgi:tetratricopeptide (TPR) repeat protein